MKPRDLNESNWDVNVAVFEVPGFDARVTADGKKMWFRVYARHCVADVTMPIADFRKAVDFISKFDVSTLKPDGNSAGRTLGSYYIEVSNSIGSFKRGKIVYRKTPAVVHIAPHRQRRDHDITFRLSLFKKLVRWYNSDIK